MPVGDGKSFWNVQCVIASDTVASTLARAISFRSDSIKGRVGNADARNTEGAR